MLTQSNIKCSLIYTFFPFSEGVGGWQREMILTTFPYGINLDTELQIRHMSIESYAFFIVISHLHKVSFQALCKPF